MPSDWIIRSRRVVLPNGIQPASLRIGDGIIREIGPFDCSPDEDAGHYVIMPGLVDTHVHINEPGRTEWEGFCTATRAAAAGGITTLIDMPLNSVPATTSVGALKEKIAAAQEKCWVDVGFWGGVVPGNLEELKPLLEAGCFGFKCFLVPSGVEEFQAVNENDLRLAMRELASLGARLLVHAELPKFLSPEAGDVRKYSNYLNSRPRIAENSAIALLLRLSRETRCAVHIVHLSSAEGVEMLCAAQRQRLPVTVETCPHYLAFCAEEVPDGATEFKCAPPVREEANRHALWHALSLGVIEMIVTDHSPCPAEMKLAANGDFFAAWGGIASLQLSLPVVWTEAASRGFTEEDVTRWMAAAPARMAGLAGKKGRIAVGCDADLVVWDPEEKFTVSAEHLLHRHKLTPYAGRRLRGVIKRTYLRGRLVSSAGRPCGKVLTRNRA